MCVCSRLNPCGAKPGGINLLFTAQNTVLCWWLRSVIDLQNLVEYHPVNLSTMPPHVAAPVAVLVCAELLVKQGVTIFCVALLLRRGSLVEVLSNVEGLSSHGRLSRDELLSSLGPPSTSPPALSCPPF